MVVARLLVYKNLHGEAIASGPNPISTFTVTNDFAYAVKSVGNDNGSYGS